MQFSKSLLRRAVRSLGWGISPSQGLYHRFRSFFVELQPDSSLYLLYCRGKATELPRWGIRLSHRTGRCNDKAPFGRFRVRISSGLPSILTVIVVSFSVSKRMPGQQSGLGHKPPPSKSLPTHHLRLTSFYTILHCVTSVADPVSLNHYESVGKSVHYHSSMCGPNMRVPCHNPIPIHNMPEVFLSPSEQRER